MKYFTRPTILFVFIFSTLLLFATAIAAQVEQVSSVVHYQHTIKSQALGEDRVILVKVPPNYGRSDIKFPVVYMLDAHAPQNAMMAGIMEQQAWGGVMPDMILVGIQNTNRLRDMSPTATERAGSGGGQKFLRFIETEVIPLVDKNYRTHPYRIFAGHSLGGLFVVYSFVERPDLFNAFIAASPVLHWDKDYVINRAEAIFKQDREWKKRLFIGVGDEPDYIAGFNAFQGLLKRVKPKGFEFEFQQLKAENHGSVVLPTYYAGLRKIFDGWAPPQSASLATVENHHKKLSDRFGYVILPPENLLNQLGYALLRAERTEEALEVFRRNAEYYSNSANVYDSLGEALEKAGQLKSARDNYEKAHKIAEQKNDTELALIFKANLERVVGKMK